MEDPIYSILAPLIGVLIGGLLTFITTILIEAIKEKRENKRRKITLKYELIGKIHSYYHYYKSQVVRDNFKEFLECKIRIYKSIPNSEKIIEESYIYINEYAVEINKKFYIMMDVEERILMLKLEVIDKYKKLDIKKFNDLIDHIIDNGNDRKANMIHDYSTILTLSAFKKIEKNIYDQIFEKEKELVKSCEIVKWKILDLLDNS